MPYAANGKISTSKFDGAVEITQAEYEVAIEGMLSGKVVTVDGGFTVADPPKPEEPPVPEPLTPAESRAQAVAAVNAERNRRMETVFYFAGKYYDCDKDSLARITGAGALAGFAMGAGAKPGGLNWHGKETPFAWIAADNTLTTMDASTCFAFSQAAAENVSAHVFAAKLLKDMDPVPDQYADDRYWPKIW